MTNGDKAKAKKGKSSQVSGKKASTKTGKSGGKAQSKPAKSGKVKAGAAKAGARKVTPPAGKAGSKRTAPPAKSRPGASAVEAIEFTDPAVAAAFQHAIKKYPNAFRKLTD